MRTKEQIDGILAALEREYPMADCTLTERDAWRLLVQVRLAAQCTDARVNLVTPALFARFPTVEAMAAADIGEVEELIRSCGFYHGKARDLVWQAQRITEVYGGKVPDNMDDLLTLPGVGRKSANLILGDVFRQPGASWWTRTASGSRTGWVSSITTRTPCASKRRCAPSSRRRNRTISATGSCCTDVPCAPRVSRSVTFVAVRRTVKR